MDSRRLMFVILATLLVLGLALSLVEAFRSGDWLGAVLNLGPERIDEFDLSLLKPVEYKELN